MKEHIEQLNHLAEVLYSETKGKYTVSRETVKTLQLILDEMQEEPTCPNDSLLLDNLLSDIVSNLDEYFKNISIKMEVKEK